MEKFHKEVNLLAEKLDLNIKNFNNLNGYSIYKFLTTVQETKSCFENGNYLATLILLRTSTEIFTKELLNRNKQLDTFTNLSSRINYLYNNKYINENHFEVFEWIRTKGNVGAHESELENEEVKDIYYSFINLIKYFFEKWDKPEEHLRKKNQPPKKKLIQANKNKLIGSNKIAIASAITKKRDELSIEYPYKYHRYFWFTFDNFTQLKSDYDLGKVSEQEMIAYSNVVYSIENYLDPNSWKSISKKNAELFDWKFTEKCINLLGDYTFRNEEFEEAIYLEVIFLYETELKKYLNNKDAHLREVYIQRYVYSILIVYFDYIMWFYGKDGMDEYWKGIELRSKKIKCKYWKDKLYYLENVYSIY